MNLLKQICTVIAVCLVLNCGISTASAYQIRIDDKGNYIRTGGINTYDDVSAESYEDTVALEAALRNSGYILVNTDSMDITQEEFEKFQTYSFWFSDYIRPDETFYWTSYRIYVYSPSYNDYMIQLNESGILSEHTRLEINTSTVVISYAYWHSKSKAGTICDEFNENIPEWFDTGYLEIRSPIDVEVKFHLPIEDTYYVFYASANTPFLVKMKTGGYNVVEVNAHKFEDREKAIIHNNMIHIEKENTIDNPYVVELKTLVDTYGIESADISGQPDYSIGQNQNIPEQKVVVEETENDKADTKENKKDITFYVIGAFIIILSIITALYSRRRKRDNE